MRFASYSFGSVQVDGVSYDHDLIIDRGKIRKRKKAASRKFRGEYGHTPLSVAEDIRAIDPDLVERESLLLASVLRQVVGGLPEGGRALVVGHSPTNEAAVLGLAGLVVPPLGKGKGVLLVEDGGDYQVEPLD